MDQQQSCKPFQLYWRGGVGIEYFTTIRDNKDNIKLRNPDDIVLDTSYIIVGFQYPPEIKMKFKIEADDISKGFTRKELAYKLCQYIWMLNKIQQHYNMEKGEFDINENKTGEHPFGYRGWSYEAYSTGINVLEYNKDEEVWDVIYINYM